MKICCLNIILIFFLFTNELKAQTYNMGTGSSSITQNTCLGTFYDSGGSGGQYENNSSATYTFCSSIPGECVMLNFTQFNVNDQFLGIIFDYVNVYDGPSTASTFMFSIYGGPFPAPFPVASSTGCITIELISDGSIRTAGWTAIINCQPCPIPQNPTQQDCNGAIPICQEQYYNPFSYTGNNGTDIIPASSCLASGELNDSWYVFTAQTSGPLSFVLSPNYTDDDYDWAIYNITNGGCQGISSGASPEISCNYSSSTLTWAGQTGPYSNAPYNGTLNSQGFAGTAFNASPNVIAGNTYVINVSNFSSSQGGYYLDLSPSIASLFDNVPPTMISIDPVGCGATSVTVYFSEPVDCSTIQAADFTVTGTAAVTVNTATGVGCGGAGTFTQQVFLSLATPLTGNGTYTVNLVGPVSDVCNNSAPSSLPFSLQTTADAGPDQIICDLNSILQAVDPFPNTGVWSQIGGPAAAIFSNTSLFNSNVSVPIPGVYSFLWTITNGGCDVSDVVTFTFGNLVIGVSPSSINICTSTSTVLTANGATTYSWSPASGLSATTGATITTSPASTTTYTVTGTDANGCSGTATAIVTVSPAPALIITNPAAVCTPGAINLTSSTITAGSSGAGVLSYWADAACTIPLASPASVSTGGVYYIKSSVGTCSDTQPVIVNFVTTPPIPTLIPNLPCAGVATLFTAGNGSLFEFFVNGISQGSTSAINTFNSGVLSVGDQICVKSYPPPFNFDGNINEAGWGSPYATSSGGPVTSGFGVNNNMDGLFLNSQSGFLNGAVASNLVNGSNNRILLFIDCIPGGFNDLTSWTNTNGSPYYSVQNLNNNITFDPGFSPDYILSMNQAFGDAFFDLYNMQTNTNNYLGSASGSPLLGFVGNAGVGDLSSGFEFSIPLGALGNPSGTINVFAMIVNDPGIAGTTFISNQFLTNADSLENNYGSGSINFGNAAPDPVSFSIGVDCFNQTCVTVPPLLVVNVNSDSICNGASSVLTASGALNYTWTPNTSISATTGSSVIVNPSSNINYTVTGTDVNGCSSSAVSTVTVTPLPTISVSPANDTICNGDNILLTANGAGAGSYAWSPNSNISSVTGSGVTVNPSSSTNYTVTGTDANGCTGQSIVPITVNPIITPTFPPFPPLCEGDPVPVLPTTSNEGITGTWNPSVVNNNVTTTYTFTPDDPSQCGGITTLTIIVDPLPTTSNIYHD